MNPNELAQQWHDAQERRRQAEIALYDVERTIRDFMEAENATAVPAHAVNKETGEVAEYLITYKPTVEYDREALYAFKEHLHPAAFEELLTNPAPPVRQVNIVKAKKLAEQGGEFKRILDAATRPGQPKLTITEVGK